MFAFVLEKINNSQMFFEKPFFPLWVVSLVVGKLEPQPLDVMHDKQLG